MNHRQLQAAIIGLCVELELDWWVWPQVLQVRPGWVDMVIISYADGRLAELKTAGAKRSPDQTRVALRMQRAGWPYRLWTPEDLRRGVIRADLENMR